MNVIVDLYGNTNHVAFSNAEASRKNHFVTKVILRDGIFKELNNLGRSLEIARRSNTDLNDKHNLYLCQYLVCEKVANSLGAYRVESVVNGNANTLLTVSKAERTAKLYFVFNAVRGDKALKLLNDLT